MAKHSHRGEFCAGLAKLDHGIQPHIDRLSVRLLQLQEFSAEIKPLATQEFAPPLEPGVAIDDQPLV